jgi:hypothetical protein
MKTTLFAACALAGLIAAPAMAQVATGVGLKGAGGIAAPPVNPAMPATRATPAMPGMSMPATPATPAIPATPSSAATAETGSAVNTAATATDLKVGALVTDSAGAELGAISKVAKVGGDTMVTLKAKGKTKTVPASSLSLSGGALVSSQTKADLWGPK